MNFTATYNGTTHTRTSKSRQYTYAVICWNEYYGEEVVGTWTSRLDLAEKFKKSHPKSFRAIVPVTAN